MVTVTKYVFEKISILYESFLFLNFQGDIAIDDVQRYAYQCQEPNNCDFENEDFCGWDNVRKIDQFDWEIIRGASSETFLSGKIIRKRMNS